MASRRSHSVSVSRRTVNENLEQGNITLSDPLHLRSALVDERTQTKHVVKRFYAKQNAQIENMLAGVEHHRNNAGMGTSISHVRLKVAIYGSLAVNIVLAIMQIYSAISSGSMSLLAITIEAVFDPMSNLIMLFCQRAATQSDDTRWPSGKSRMTTVGNVCFCCIMACASVILIVESAQSLLKHDAHTASHSTTSIHLVSLVLVCAALLLKLCMFLFCWSLRTENSQVRMLWQDHRNDLFINGFGILTAVIGAKVVWWVDAAGAIVLALGIFISWSKTALYEFSLLIGISATPEFLQLVTYTCVMHHHDVLQLATCRAYHAGEGVVIEVDVVMDKDLTLHETHDVAEDLQNKLERLPGVERCFVHVDYETTHAPEHRKNV